MSRSASRRPGFTLVELLVVIAIIGVLMALLLPAVQKVRESAVVTGCRNNLHNIGVALHNYHTQVGSFPPARGVYATDPANEWTIGPGWLVAILPYVEEGNVFDDYWGNDTKPIPVLACPADPRVSNANPPYWGMTSYLGVTGSDNDWYVQAYGPTNGIFNIGSTNGIGTRLTDITDGDSNTLMVGERPPSNDLYWGMWIWSDYDNLLSTRQLYSVYDGCTYPGLYGPGRLDGQCQGDSNHFWSLHPAGGNWLFGDGSVRFLSYGASAVTIPLATREGNEVINEQY